MSRKDRTMNHKDDCTCPICQIPRLEKTIAEQTEQIAMLEKAVDTGVEAEEKLEAENKRLKEALESLTQPCQSCNCKAIAEQALAAQPQKGE